MHRVTRNLSVLQSLQFVQSVTGKTSLELRWVFSPHVRESKTVLDSGSQAVDFGFQIVDSSQCQWSLDSGFQSLVGFRKNVPGSGIRISLHGATWGEYLLRLPRVYFLKTNKSARASRASALRCGLWEIYVYKCLFIPNWMRKIMWLID